jgi:short subunit fatty acid transporter
VVVGCQLSVREAATHPRRGLPTTDNRQTDNHTANYNQPMRSNPLARAGSRIADACERWFPDAFVFALAAIVLVFAGGLAIGVAPAKLAYEFGSGFWSLVNFTMQMALVIVGGFVVASSPPVARLTSKLAAIPKTGRGAVAFVAAFAMLSSLLSWGLSLIFTGLLVREITRRNPRVDYRAIGAAAYLGLGSVWALGLSSSAALLQATKSSIPASLLPITGVIPLTQTIFLWQNLVMALVLIVLSVVVAYYSAPRDEDARSMPLNDAEGDPSTSLGMTPATPGERDEGDVPDRRRVLLRDSGDVRAVRRRQVGDRGAARHGRRKLMARTPRLDGADLQRGRGVAEPRQSLLDAPADGHSRRESARSRGLLDPAVVVSRTGRALSLLAVRPHVAVHSASLAMSVSCRALHGHSNANQRRRPCRPET